MEKQIRLSLASIEKLAERKQKDVNATVASVAKTFGVKLNGCFKGLEQGVELDENLDELCFKSYIEIESANDEKLTLREGKDLYEVIIVEAGNSELVDFSTIAKIN